jgi:hypothetical protein
MKDNNNNNKKLKRGEKSDFFFLRQGHTMYPRMPGLILTILLPQSPECWDCRYAPPHLALIKFKKLIKDGHGGSQL